MNLYNIARLIMQSKSERNASSRSEALCGVKSTNISGVPVSFVINDEILATIL